jgi:uncharacterized protein (TIGR02118 family)
MVRISILYPNSEGARFDLRYYVETHMPMSIRFLSAHRGFRGVSVEQGLGGAAPETPPPFIAMCHFLFLSMPNYTDIEPVIQFNEVLITQ